MKKVMFKNKNMGIKGQFLSSYLIVGILPIVIFAFIAGSIIKSSMYHNEVSSLKQISSIVTNNLDQWGDDNILLVEDIASSQVVLTNNYESIQSELRNKQAQDTGILNVMYVNRQGKVLADALGSKGETIANEGYFEKMSSEYSYVSNVLMDEDKDISFIIFSAPVKVDNNVTGYIVNKVSIDEIGKSIGKLTYSDSGEVYTFNSEGYITYHSDPQMIMKNTKEQSDGLREGVQKALEGNFNSIDYVDQKEEGVAVYNYIPSLNWGTMTTNSKTDIYKAFVTVLFTCLPVVGILIALIILVALYISKRFVKFFAQMISFTKEVAEGNLIGNCKLEGAAEIVDIGDNLNEMVESLKKIILNVIGKSDVLQSESAELHKLAGEAEKSTKEITKAMEEIAGGSVSQAEDAEEILGQVQELDTKMNELMNKIDQTNQALERSNQAIENGSHGTDELKTYTKVMELLNSYLPSDNSKVLGLALKNYLNNEISRQELIDKIQKYWENSK